MSPTTRPLAVPERELLALQAVHHLAAQFAAEPDFPALMRLLLLTLAGQFGVPGVMAVVRRPGTDQEGLSLFGVGPFEELVAGIDDPERYHCRFCLKSDSGPCYAPPISQLKGKSADARCLRDDFELSAVIPVMQDHHLLGFVGMGLKHTGLPLGEDEMELLRAMIGTVTPLLLNCYVLADMSANSSWYESLLDDVPSALFVFSSGGRLRMCNQAAAAIIGQALPDGGDDANRVLSFSDLLERIDLPETIRKFVDGVTATPPGSDIVVDKKSVRIYNVSVSRVIDPVSGNREVVLMMDDVTQARETENSLLELEQLAERGAMVASIAHEIRNQLAVLSGGLELCQLVLKRGDRERAENYLNRAAESVRQLERFTVELMDKKKAEAVRQPASLNDIISNVVTFLRVQRRFKNVTLATDLDSSLPLLEIDANQISQLLLNFLNNSADAVAEAGRSDGLITVRTALGDAGVTLSVTDNGCGISDDIKDRLFQLRTTTKKEGHGYGLVTCARIIANHQADVSIDSESGSYTSIYVTLPLSAVPTTA